MSAEYTLQAAYEAALACESPDPIERIGMTADVADALRQRAKLIRALEAELAIVRLELDKAKQDARVWGNAASRWMNDRREALAGASLAGASVAEAQAAHDQREALALRRDVARQAARIAELEAALEAKR